MGPDDPRLMRLAGSVREGGIVDWDEEERAAPDEDGRQFIRCLRDLYQIGEVHRHDHRVGQGDAADSSPPRNWTGLAQSTPAGGEATRTIYRISGELERIGPYRILQEIGAGGMGVVYAAEQEKPVRRRVALKLVKRSMDSREAVARFEAERQALALMNHPNIARVFDGGTTDQGHPFFVMEFVQGLPVTEHCDRRQLTVRERLELFSRVCEAVQHAHQKGIIHRDIKPSNILVSDQDGQPVPKIIDFGAAKATSQRLTDKTLYTQVGMFLGTPEYSSPEQAELSGDVDTRADVYSLGMVLYELLVGELPFDRTQFRKAGSSELLRIIREEEAVRPSARLMALGEASAAAAARRGTDPSTLCKQLQGDLDWIVLRALEKTRTRRYQSASELAADIARHERHEAVLASPPGIRYRARKFARRHRLAVGVTTVLVTTLVGFAVTMTVQARRIARERDRANREAETAKQVSDFLAGLFKVSDPFEARGNAITAREILDKGAEKIGRELSDQPLTQARLMDTIGNVYRSLGMNDAARPLLERALQIRETELGPEHPDVAQSLYSVAFIHADMARPEESMTLLRRALAIREKALGPDHPDVAYTLWALGMFADYEEGMQAFDRGQAIFEKIDPDHIGAAWCMNDRAKKRILLRGDYAEARPLMQRALEIKEKKLPSDHPDVGVGLNNLAYVLIKLGEYAGAQALLERALALAEKSYGPEHLAVVLPLSTWGELMRVSHKDTEALPLLDRAIAIQETRGAQDDPVLAEVLNSRALTLLELGQIERAEADLKRALAIHERKLGPEAVDVAVTLEGYATLLWRTGRKAQAEELESRARAIRVQQTKMPLPVAGRREYVPNIRE